MWNHQHHVFGWHRSSCCIKRSHCTLIPYNSLHVYLQYDRWINVCVFVVFHPFRVRGRFVLWRSQLSHRWARILPRQSHAAALCRLKQKEESGQGRRSEEYDWLHHEVWDQWGTVRVSSTLMLWPFWMSNNLIYFIWWIGSLCCLKSSGISNWMFFPSMYTSSTDQNKFWYWL